MALNIVRFRSLSRQKKKWFILTVKTDNAGTSNSDQFTIPLPGSGTYNFSVVYDGTDTTHTANTSLTLTFPSGAGTYDIRIEGTFPRIYFNNGGDKAKLLKVQFGDNEWSSFAGAFYGCANLVSVQGTPNLSGVTSLTLMFRGCSNLVTLDFSGWNTSNVTSLNGMFFSCGKLRTLYVESWDTANVTDLGSMFNQCSLLATLDVSGWDTSLVRSLQQTFYGCSKLATLDVSGWNTANVVNMESTFRGCYLLDTLDVSGWNTAKVTTMSYMCFDCRLLASLDVSGWDTSLVTSPAYMFQGCSDLTTITGISGWNTIKMTSFAAMLQNCALLDIDVSAWSIVALTGAASMFNGSGFSQTNYDKLLSLTTGWPSQAAKDNVTFHAGTAKYDSADADIADGRAKLVAAVPTGFGWSITDGGAA